ncbi:hypothetical protein PROFUN_04023 [Planoprotostelium fungivorum]|uniref:Trm112p-like protein n=1 Tax=Planoprotostelium fungivorum TaxID=1890364 RepID=A0A2P6NW72_9EUKA|nr:hypothetical protein PROFUN_04023 [Planoprotostelium fungivorum]
MRILSHNMLQCIVKGCGAANYPLRLNGEAVHKESEYNEDFIKHMMSKIDYPALYQASQDVKIDLPSSLPEDYLDNEEFLKKIHDVTHIEEGGLYCNNCKRIYPIKNGIVNMLLNENEV